MPLDGVKNIVLVSYKPCQDGYRQKGKMERKKDSPSSPLIDNASSGSEVEQSRLLTFYTFPFQSRMAFANTQLTVLTNRSSQEKEA